jgi:hypothetical protein
MEDKKSFRETELEKLIKTLEDQEDTRNFNSEINTLIINWAKKELK